MADDRTIADRLNGHQHFLAGLGRSRDTQLTPLIASQTFATTLSSNNPILDGNLDSFIGCERRPPRQSEKNSDLEEVLQRMCVFYQMFPPGQKLEGSVLPRRRPVAICDLKANIRLSAAISDHNRAVEPNTVAVNRSNMKGERP